MEKIYWLSRKKASLKMAREAPGSEARLIHYDLAGRYEIKAGSDETQAIDLAEAVPPAIRGKASKTPSEGSQHD